MGIVIWRMLWTCVRCGQTEYIETPYQTELPPGWGQSLYEDSLCPSCLEKVNHEHQTTRVGSDH